MQRKVTKNIESKKLSEQVKNHSKKEPDKEPEFEGNDIFISTGSTLLDLAISGGRVYGGGIPGGIMVEIFGPSSAGKTVLLCEIAGAVQRRGGDIMFKDPEARLNKQFAKIFDLNVDDIEYDTPNTIPEVFGAVRKWKPKTEAKIHGIFADSLAALSTNLEMDNDEGDKMGMRRAKEFSEECRKTCRVLADKGYLMVCSNQVRQTGEAYGPKYKSPGGEAIGFYSSLRLKFDNPKKIKKKKTINGKEVEKVIGVETEIEVYKSSVWKPYNRAPLYILFDYGIDDIRSNLQFLKRMTGATTYVLNGQNIGKSIEDAIDFIEQEDKEDELKEEVIQVWYEIEKKFETKRKSKKR